MNGIGITGWQDGQTDYPLVNAGKFSGVFCDASFVQFDAFVPTLNSFSLISTASQLYDLSKSLKISITMDDGAQDFYVLASEAVKGKSIRLRANSRYYGTLVFGRSILDVTKGVYGSDVIVGASFASSAVRSIDSHKGLYSLQGLGGAVTLELDNTITYNNANHELQAVSIPTNLNTIATSDSYLYLLSSNQRLLRVSNNSPTYTEEYLVTLDKQYDVIYAHGAGKLIGWNNNTKTLYDLTVQPANPIYKATGDHETVNPFIHETLKSFTIDNSGNLIACFSNTLLYIPYSSGSYTITVNNTNRQKKTLYLSNQLANSALINVNGNYLLFVDGAPRYSGTTIIGQYSNTVYAVTGLNFADSSSPTIFRKGMLSMDGLVNVPQIAALFIRSNILYAVANTATSHALYTIDTGTLIVTQLYENSNDALFDRVVGAFSDAHTIEFRAVNPLKTINGLAPTKNMISMVGNNIFDVITSGEASLTFALSIKDANLNIKRVIKYE
jgi:hypothetical protein